MIDNDCSYPTLLKQLDEILEHPELLAMGDMEEALKIKREILDSIQKELMESRRKKINKLMNIPEVIPPMTEERRIKIERSKKALKEYKLKHPDN